MATLTISAGVTSGGYTIANGQTFNKLIVLSGGTAVPNSVGSGGFVTVSSGGTLEFGAGGQIGVSGIVDVLAGGFISGVMVGGRGTLSGAGTLLGTNTGGGLIEGLTIGSKAILSEGTLASGVTVANGGELILGGTFAKTSGTLIRGGGLEIVSASNSAVSSVIENDGSQIVSGGFTSGTIISRGGSQTLSVGAASLDTTVLSGGVEYVFDALGEGTFSTIISAGGVVELASGGAASQSQVAGRLLIYSGSAVSASVLKGGEIQVSSGGLDSATTVRSGGAEYIYGSGAAQAVEVLNGGVEQIGRGARATGTILLNGAQRVRSGGIASGTVVSHGLESVESGGRVSGLTLDAGGKLIDDGTVRLIHAATFAGSISGTGVLGEAGGAILTLSGDGSAFSGQAAISGGTIELANADAIGTGAVSFASGSASETLQIDAAAAPLAGGFFANTISGFSGANDFIDLRSIAFVSGATATVNGSTLTLVDGGNDYKFHLAGGFGSVFPVTSDGHGGTLIDPHVAGFAQATAGFSPRGGGVVPITHGGTSGYAPVLNAGSASGRG